MKSYRLVRATQEDVTSFSKFIHNDNIIDFDFTANPFTYDNKRKNENAVFSRLESVLANYL